MTKIPFLLTLLVTLLVCLLPAAPAQALVARTFVSAAGGDSNNCANVATPCRHLATAFAATAPDGEIYVLDPANYGSLTITHGVSIEGHGWASIAPPSGTSPAAITINANSGDKINIIGVVLDGTALEGTRGIVFNSGGSLTIADTVVRNFDYGILLAPTSGAVSFVITNTIVSDNATGGILYFSESGSATANVTIDHVVATNGQYGIEFVTSTGTATAAISNSIASNNSNTGIFIVGSSTLAVSIDNSNISGNGAGIAASGNATKVLLGRSVVTSNSAFSIGNSTSTFFTYQNNQVNLNGNSNQISGNALVALPFQ
jgi:hypothetical protein